MAYYPVYYQYPQPAPVAYIHQNKAAYNPQFNGWDTIEDMPIYDNRHNIQPRTEFEKNNLVQNVKQINNNFYDNLIKQQPIVHPNIMPTNH